MTRIVDALIFFAAVLVVFHLADEWLLPVPTAANSPTTPPASHAYRFG